MKWFRQALLVLTLFLMGCQSIAPTPVLIVDLRKENNEVIRLYEACTDGANYVPDREGCDPLALEAQTLVTMDKSKVFISADIHQPQGYDIYLQTAMIFFRIGERNTKQYTEAERIARQFFEVQKASSRGKSLNTARFYWAAMSAGHASWQWYNDRFALDGERKTDLLLCYAEGNVALQEIDPGPRKVRLLQYLQVLKAITDALP